MNFGDFYQVEYRINNMPVHLLLNMRNAHVAFLRNTPVAFMLLDQPEDKTKLTAEFTHVDFKLGDEEFQYDTYYDYKNIPVMKQWLVEQQFEPPTFIHGS